ncbi:MAG: hypothetical protein SNJ82_06775 [Gemmataceae bacterium]
MYPHRIRLRGPWQWHSATATGTITLPGRIAESGLVTFSRRFGLPSNLDAHERVWLLRPDAAEAPATLNGIPLPPGPVCDLTALLRPRNELRLDTIGSPGEVALEIRATAYLSEVAQRGGQVFGRVVGLADRALDLYALGGNTTLAQASIVASEAGTPFVLKPCGPVERVELVNGGVIWYSFPIAWTKPADRDHHENSLTTPGTDGGGLGSRGGRDRPPCGGD